MKVVALGDLHVGSRVAVADPSDTPTKDPGAKVREKLHELWYGATHGPWHAPDVLIVNGDAIDGPNRKSSGLGTWTSDMLEQAQHALGLLNMWGAKRVYVLRGSGYHVDAGGGMHAEEWLARELGAEEYPNQEHVPWDRRMHSGYHWYLALEGVTYHVAHKIGVSRVWHYQSTPTAREMLYCKLNNQLRGQVDKYGVQRKTRIVLRSHAHYFNTVGYSGSDGFVLPCWKALDDWMMGNSAIAIAPDIGFVGFTIHGREWTNERHLWQCTDAQPAPLTVVRGDWGGDGDDSDPGTGRADSGGADADAPGLDGA